MKNFNFKLKALGSPKIVLLMLLFISIYTEVLAQSWPSEAHDPSSIVKCGDRYWYFSTGDANREISMFAKYSYDMVTWQDGPPPFTPTDFPEWINDYVHGATDSNGQPVFHGIFWAPDIIYMNNQYYLYYSCSEWGTMTSTIGCVTNKSLNPEDPDYNWVDVGFLGLYSYQPGIALNVIDPALSRSNDGKIWMTYGSFNERGMVVTEIDSISGKPKTDAGNIPGKTIANSWTGPNSWDYAEGEGACMVFRNGYYYLFYNKGGCCRGVDSSYYVVMGRSQDPKGPFVDKDGKQMRVYGAESGGTVVFQHDDSRGFDDRYYGPGHIGVFNENGTDYITFHYYQPPSGWPARLGLAKLDWGADGWPFISLDFLEEGYYTLKNVNSNKFLDVQNHNAINGAALYQYSEDQTEDAQKWLFTPLGTGEYTIQSYEDESLYVEAAGNNNEELLLLTNQYTGAINQKFRVVQSPNGQILIYPSIQNNLFEIPFAYTFDYQVKLWPNTNHPCQRWIATKFEPSLSISRKDKFNVTMFPNPALDYIHIKGNNIYGVEIYNELGQKIVSSNTKNASKDYTIEISTLSSGIYTVKIFGENSLAFKKLIKK
ncbi:family 43 glycosylhydrolase [Flavobacteriaceae bacterium SZ-1-7]